MTDTPGLNGGGRKKTVLVIRSSFVTHCGWLFRELTNAGYAGDGVRWIWIVQPQVAREFHQLLDGADVSVWNYPHSRFVRSKLMTLFGGMAGAETIDDAFVPVNNAEARGYFGILLFLSAVGARNIHFFTPDHRMYRVTPATYVSRRLFGAVMSCAGAIALVTAAPLVVLYAACRAVGARFGARVPVPARAGS